MTLTGCPLNFMNSKHIIMKKQTSFAIALLAMAFVQCKSPNERVEDSKDDLDKAKTEQAEATENYQDVKKDSTSDYAVLKAQTQKVIADNNARIAEFKVKLNTESAANQKKLQVRIDTLDARNNRLQRDLDNYKDEGKAKWDTFKTRVQHSVNDVKKDIDDYKKEHNYK